jgi:GTP-binding protein Era
MKSELFRSGFVSIIGRPNVGKSSLLNHIIGEKTSIVSEKPQTTRNRITAIKNLSDAQIVFMDTPGIYRAKDQLGRLLVEQSYSTYKDSDIVLFLTEFNKRTIEDDFFIIDGLKDFKVYLALNKIDLVSNKALLFEFVKVYSERFSFAEIYPISAVTGENVEPMVAALAKALPEGPKYFPEDMITDQPENLVMAEFIREQVFLSTSQEIPYSTAVIVEEVEEGNREGVLLVYATIYVERDSQKGIIIGKKGSKLKEIGTNARIEIERRFGGKIVLNLFVKVKKEWTKDSNSLFDFGYRD